jgi:hypothetical protein
VHVVHDIAYRPQIVINRRSNQDHKNHHHHCVFPPYKHPYLLFSLRVHWCFMINSGLVDVCMEASGTAVMLHAIKSVKEGGLRKSWFCIKSTTTTCLHKYFNHTWQLCICTNNKRFCKTSSIVEIIHDCANSLHLQKSCRFLRRNNRSKNLQLCDNLQLCN